MKNSMKTLVLLSAVLSSAVCAQEIYKWTDEFGNVNYGDRPDGDDVETVALVSRPTDADAVRSRVEARHEQQQERSQARAARDEAERKSAEERRAAEAEKAERCTAYRARLEKFVTSRRLYKTNDNGERIYLDDTQMQKARADLQSRIEETCSG